MSDTRHNLAIERRDRAHKHDETWWFDDTPDYIETYDDAIKYVDDMMEITSNPFEYRIVTKIAEVVR